MSVMIIFSVIAMICLVYMNPERVVAIAMNTNRSSTKIPRSLLRARKWLIHEDPSKSRYTTRERFVKKLNRACKKQEFVSFVADTFMKLMETSNSRHLKLLAVNGMIGVNSDIPAVRSSILKLRMKRIDLEIPEILEADEEDDRNEDQLLMSIVPDDSPEGKLPPLTDVDRGTFLAAIRSDSDEEEEEEVVEAA